MHSLGSRSIYNSCARPAKLHYHERSVIENRGVSFVKAILIRSSKALFLLFLSTSIAVSCLLAAQQPGTSTSQPSAPASQSVEPVTTLKVSSRMVTVEVSARDSKGHPVPGLTVDDFQVFEQIHPKKDQHPQKIAI